MSTKIITYVLAAIVIIAALILFVMAIIDRIKNSMN